jgi:hypothetical protein
VLTFLGGERGINIILKSTIASPECGEIKNHAGLVRKVNDK